MNSPWIRLFSGKKFHILDPKAREIDILDIAHNLSQLCRFTGATKGLYTIAQHCCHVSDILPIDSKLEGLLHDASEAYLGDVNSPLKSCLPQYKEIEIKAEQVIAKKFKLRFPYPAGIKTADMIMLVTEMKYLMPNADYKNIPFSPLDMPNFKIWTSEEAYTEFLDRYTKLTQKN